MSIKSNWKNFYQEIGGEIRSKRLATEMSLEQVAKNIGLSGGAVLHRYETGERTPPLHILLELGKLLADNYYFFIPQDYMSERSVDPSSKSQIFSSRNKGGIYNRIYKLLDEIDDNGVLLKAVIRDISTTLNIGVVALFEYVWDRSTLEKVDEYVHTNFPPFEQSQQQLEETYNVWRSQYVTELAWANSQDEYRFIIDYARILAAFPRRVNRASIEWHRKVVDDVLSTMYGIIGTSQKFYAIRCFNRSDNVSGLLDRIQYHLLKDICGLLSFRIDMKSKERSLRNMRSLHDLLNEKGAFGLKRDMSLICNKILSEGAKNIAILWGQNNMLDLSSGFVHGEYFKDWDYGRQTSVKENLASQSLCQRIYSNDKHFIVDVFEESRNAEINTIEDHINKINKQKETNIGRLIVFPLNLSSSKKGALIIPVETGIGSQNFTTINISQAIPETIEILSTYADVIGNVIREHEEYSKNFETSRSKT